MSHGRAIILRESFLVFRGSPHPILLLAIHFPQPIVCVKRGLSGHGIGVQFRLRVSQPIAVKRQPAYIKLQNKRSILRGIPAFSGHFHRALERFMGTIQIARAMTGQTQIIPSAPFVGQ